ncbi:MAG: hypothetical protein ACE5GE_01400 [Phycisphaerae bacterium]
MNPIQPVDGNVQAQQPIQAPQAASASAASSSTTVASMSSSTSITMVNTQVDAMLESLGGGLQDNQMLKMVIALMILQAMLAKDGGSQQAAIDGLMNVLGAVGSRGSQAISIQSATNVVQIQQQSNVLMTSQAALAPEAAQGDPTDSSGENLDMTA